MTDGDDDQHRDGCRPRRRAGTARLSWRALCACLLSLLAVLSLTLVALLGLQQGSSSTTLQRRGTVAGRSHSEGEQRAPASRLSPPIRVAPAPAPGSAPASPPARGEVAGSGSKAHVISAQPGPRRSLDRRLRLILPSGEALPAVLVVIDARSPHETVRRTDALGLISLEGILAGEHACRVSFWRYEGDAPLARHTQVFRITITDDPVQEVVHVVEEASTPAVWLRPATASGQGVSGDRHRLFVCVRRPGARLDRPFWIPVPMVPAPPLVVTGLPLGASVELYATASAPPGLLGRSFLPRLGDGVHEAPIELAEPLGAVTLRVVDAAGAPVQAVSYVMRGHEQAPRLEGTGPVFSALPIQDELSGRILRSTGDDPVLHVFAAVADLDARIFTEAGTALIRPRDLLGDDLAVISVSPQDCVVGRVVCVADGRALSHLRVTLHDAEGRTMTETETPADGGFCLYAPGARGVEVRVHPRGQPPVGGPVLGDAPLVIALPASACGSESPWIRRTRHR